MSAVALGGALWVCGLLLATTPAQGAPLLNEVHTIATASVAVPVEHDFSVAAAGSYQVTLADLGATPLLNAPLASVKLAVTNGSTVVGTPLQAAGTFQFSATAAGTYTIHVVGTPGTAAGSGPIGIQVGTAASPQSIAAFSDNLALPTQALPNGEGVLDDSFTVASSGAYTLALTDLQVPQSLGTLTLALTVEGGSIVQVLPDPNNSGALQASVALQSGVNYRITAGGLAAAGVGAGLFSAVVTPSGGGAPVYAKAIAVGRTTLLGTPALTAGSHTLQLADLSFPATLTQLSAVVVRNGQAVVPPLTAPGAQTFTATAGTYQVFGLATPQTTAPAAGAYSLQVQPAAGGAAEFSLARAVTDASSPLVAYSFDTTVATAGAYTAALTNFSFPVPLISARFAVVQGGALLGAPLATAGNISVNAQAAPLTFLVLAQPDPTLGGLFDVNLLATGGTTAAFDMTQGVGAAFIARKITVTTAGTYGLSASDVGFPASFTSFAVIVTQGGNNLGSIFSLGNQSLPATPGDYFVSIVAQPSSAAQAGTYALTMALSPVVSLTSSAASVTSGGTVTLTWSAQNATACTASGGWSGTQQISGTATSAALSANTTFTLTCTGIGGSAAQSVTVTAAAAPAKTGGGGGGALDGAILLALSLFVGLRVVRV